MRYNNNIKILPLLKSRGLMNQLLWRFALKNLLTLFYMYQALTPCECLQFNFQVATTTTRTLHLFKTYSNERNLASERHPKGPRFCSHDETQVGLDRTDYTQGNNVEKAYFLAQEKLEKTLKCLLVHKLFPRARIIENVNTNFRNNLQFRWFSQELIFVFSWFSNFPRAA